MCCVLMIVAGLGHGAELTIPPSQQVVIDNAGVIDAATRGRITTLLVLLRERTTAEVKVLTVISAAGEDPVTFAQRHFDLWQLGKKGADNGALILLVMDIRRVRIHTGYGLEGTLPDSWCGSLSRRVSGEKFAKGAYAAGLEEMAKSVANEIATAAKVDLGVDVGQRFLPSPSPNHSPMNRWFVLILVVAMIIYSIWSKIRGRSMDRGSYGGTGWGNSGGGFGGGFGGSFGGGSSGGGFSGGGGRSGGGGGGAGW